MKKSKIISFVLTFIIVLVSIIIKTTYASSNNITSEEYRINNNKIYAIPTSSTLKLSEFLSKIDFNGDIEVYNSDNEKVDIESNVGTGYSIKNNNVTYSIVVNGDITGDGLIQIGDVSALYNHYKSNRTVDGLKLEAGLLTGNSKVMIGDVAKLYNYYKGKKPFTYYKEYANINNDEDLEVLTNERISEIRNTPNSDISQRTGRIYYVSNDGDDNNDGLSEDRPFKTLDKLYTLFNKDYKGEDKIIDGSTILFRDGDVFKGKFEITKDDIMLGSYGDISKGKPLITRSTYDGAKEGEWTEVKPNIWKYSVNGDDPFTYDVGVIWFFCKEGNNNCSKKMSSDDRTFEFSQKIATNSLYDETNIESKLPTLLTHDLETYHTGHPNARNAKAKTLYLYSMGNPATRFDEIEFAQAHEPIMIRKDTGRFTVDNLAIKYTSSSGILLWADTANFIVTNCEIGYIGGAIHQYTSNGEEVSFYGNGINLYGSVTTANGVDVSDGFVVKNNYVYQVFDAALSFQKSVSDEARMEKALFKDNVIEYSNYSIEYWTYTTTEDPDVLERSHIGTALYHDNIMRYSGVGISETRPNRGNSAHLKNWQRKYGYNIVDNKIEVKNNYFSGSVEQFIYLNSTYFDSLPMLVNNTFIGKSSDTFGYYYSTDTNRKNAIFFEKDVLDNSFPYNRFIVSNEGTIGNRNGTSNEVEWEYNESTRTLKINGTGAMEDYSLENKAPWYDFKDSISKIEIGENVTKVGNYSFYDLTRVDTIRIDSKVLEGFAGESKTGTNYIFYHVGNDNLGITLIFGSEVTKIPDRLLAPSSSDADAPNIVDIVFEGEKITSIGTNALSNTHVTALKIPNGVTSLSPYALNRNKELKFVVLPDSFVNISDWTIPNCSNLEKVVYGPTVKYVGNSTFHYDNNLTTLVLPHNTNKTKNNPGIIQSVNPIDVYGDSNTEEWINSVVNASGQTNITYHPLEEYNISITSNNGIHENATYNSSYTFTSDKNVSIYMYYDDSDGERHYVDADYTKDGNTYTINSIKSDIYIEVD